MVSVRKTFWRENWQAVFLFSRVRPAVFQVSGRGNQVAEEGWGGGPRAYLRSFKWIHCKLLQERYD